MADSRQEGRLEDYLDPENARSYDRRWAAPRGVHRDLRKQRALGRALKLLCAALGRSPQCILDAPSGTGRMGRFWERRAAPGSLVLGLDGSHAMLRQAQVKGWSRPLVAGDLAHMPLGDGTVDVLVCIRFLHLVRSREARVAFLTEAARVTRGGLIVDYRHGQTPRGLGRRLRRVLARLAGKTGPRIWPGRAQALDEVRQGGFEVLGVVPVRRPWWIGDKMLIVALPEGDSRAPHGTQAAGHPSQGQA
ncbi:MAG TPA: class I SAM-dependent methyltransferase [Planctomycetes bacterium]|nr:class I SAM-dependent methyltransferase [Planctomycetota bacterium]HIL37222.1 class I SAM-dependent methyltransferase [Planctomycetota bacterium]